MKFSPVKFMIKQMVMPTFAQKADVDDMFSVMNPQII